MLKTESPISMEPRGLGLQNPDGSYLWMVFGNGVQIDTQVIEKAGPEVITEDPDTGVQTYSLPRGDRNLVQGMDVVQVHFVPNTARLTRVSKPENIPQEEIGQVRIDCLTGFLSLAYALKANRVQIIDHQNGADFFLFSHTNTRLAAFLRTRCGFRGTLGGIQVWVEASKFTSDENIAHMLLQLEQLKSQK
jgi:hypothetical protein